ncbi:hypothetical protein THTE_3204 [Thermogutta terrifontis]|uniref:Uncharacterized protein n=1 Tax=Thermogutta terrifontis TaxID=1331910 RepID=A0A286RIP0_9BACT|nr:hypothetical protein THTE_3204 [Thermogutta terrifontis]
MQRPFWRFGGVVLWTWRDPLMPCSVAKHVIFGHDFALHIDD